MSMLSPYRMAGSHDSNLTSQQVSETGPLSFVSLLEFVSEIYQVNLNHNTFKSHVSFIEISFVLG